MFDCVVDNDVVRAHHPYGIVPYVFAHIYRQTNVAYLLTSYVYLSNVHMEAQHGTCKCVVNENE